MDSSVILIITTQVSILMTLQKLSAENYIVYADDATLISTGGTADNE